MRMEFVRSLLNELLSDGVISPDDRILAVCAGAAEVELFHEIGFKHFTISSLDDTILSYKNGGVDVRLCDVRDLANIKEQYDFTFVSDGLHHCDVPHFAVYNMYTAARRGVIIIESRDCLFTRLGVKLGLVESYEESAVLTNAGIAGGVNFSCVPNYVYRWTERELEKLIRSMDPTGEPKFLYYYGFSLSARLLEKVGRVKFALMRVLGKARSILARKQCNTFGMVVLKPSKSFEYLKNLDGKWVYCRSNR